MIRLTLLLGGTRRGDTRKDRVEMDSEFVT